jgi:integrase/recombinase XerC
MPMSIPARACRPPVPAATATRQLTLLLATAPLPAAAPAGASTEVLASWLARRATTTVRTYCGHATRFAAWLGLPTLEGLVPWLEATPRGLVTARVLGYLTALEQSRAPATHNAALAAIRSLVRHLGRLERIPWATLDIAPLPVTPYRDTAGPGAAAVARLRMHLRVARDTGPQGPRRRATRDLAIIRLLFDMALRRGELVALDVAHVLRAPGDVPHTLLVRGKGRRDHQRVAVPPAAGEALIAWLTVRGASPGPLFTACGGRRPGGRLDGRSIAKLILRLAEDASGGAERPRLTPHMLRHSAISEALDRTGGDLRAVQAYSRHADPKTLLIYDDHRSGAAARVAALLSDA